MTLPNFLVVGAMKSGTSSLWDYLGSHPQVFMARIKEPNFFVEQRNYHKGLDWYEGLFDGAQDAIAIGEASPQYTMAHGFPGVPRRIVTIIPDVRVIYILRHPVERMRSHYLHNRSIGTETRPPETAFRDLGYLHTSRYMYQLGHYLEHVPRDRIKLVTAEALRDRRVETVASIFSFLGVDPSFSPASLDRERHVTANKRVVSPRYQRVRGGVLARLVAKVTPLRARKVARRMATRPARVADVVIPPELEEQILEALRPEVAALRAYMDPGFDGWGIA